MKKSLALLLAIVFIFTLASCGEDKNSSTTAAKKTEPKPVTTYTPHGMCALCEENATQTFLDFNNPVYLCDNCFSQETICVDCENESRNASYRSKYFEYYCDECYGKGNKSACDKCHKLVKKTYFACDEDCGDCERYICEKCYNEKFACVKCKDASKETDYKWEYNLYFCTDCYNSGEPLACAGSCGETEELIKYSVGDKECYFCKDCYNDAILCNSCSNSLKTALPRKELSGYYCDDCYKNIKVCKKCRDTSKKTDYKSDIGGYFCSECDAENRICKNCGDASKKTDYDSISEVYYCDDCFGEGEKESCSWCKKLFKKLTEIQGYNHTDYLCKDCVEIRESCYKCKDTSKKAKYYKKYKVYCCDDCYIGKISVCDFCNEVTADLSTLDYGSDDAFSLCAECYSQEKLCGNCSSLFKPASYRESLFPGYSCDDCFKFESICAACGDANQETSYRSEYSMYFCDNCYGDGSYSLCVACYKLFDYELFEYDDECEYYMGKGYLVCRECCKDMLND